jgi:ribulose-phosphate 3-epimerase
MIEIFPTAVPKDADDLAERAAFVRGFSTNFHIDADDGIFTPLVCWPYVAKGEFADFDLSAAEGLDTEVHLMVQDPREIGRLFARVGARAVFGHVETFLNVEDAKQTLSSWKAEGAREAGLAILFDTPLEILDPFVSLCDFVCFMASAQIGAQGATFDSHIIDKIKLAHEKYPGLQIEVDIGVSENTIGDLVRAGATRFGVGSAISKAPDPATAYAALVSAAGAV